VSGCWWAAAQRGHIYIGGSVIRKRPSATRRKEVAERNQDRYVLRKEKDILE
jgi:hypothetical protein